MTPAGLTLSAFAVARFGATVAALSNLVLIQNYCRSKFKGENLGIEAKKNGSGAWIRTRDQVVNSHLLYR